MPFARKPRLSRVLPRTHDLNFRPTPFVRLTLSRRRGVHSHENRLELTEPFNLLDEGLGLVPFAIHIELHEKVLRFANGPAEDGL